MRTTLSYRAALQQSRPLGGSYWCGAEWPTEVPQVQQVAVLGGESGLLSAARSGDQASFERLIEPHIAAGYRLAATMLNDPGRAEDAVQEATLRAWRSLGQLRSSAHFRTWFLSIVANRSRSMRSERWWSVIRVNDTRRGSPDPADSADQREDRLGALPALAQEDEPEESVDFSDAWGAREVASGLALPR